MTNLEQVLQQAQSWIDHDPDAKTQAELQDLVNRLRANPHDQATYQELSARFTGPLAFGTAGLRGPIMAGESGMNVAVVTRATAGLMAYLNEKMDKPRVVVGCDARHGSAQFHQAACEVIAAAGGVALRLPGQLPTPLTAFAVRHLDADAGIMVTASHNPPADNGYKVYLGGRAADDLGRGRQIVPPADADIAAKIAATPPADQVPRTSDGIENVDITEEYFHAATAEYPRPAADLKIVLTPMHGVGAGVAMQAFARAGFTDVTLVEKQAQPDPDFPTVSFPNPEEPGALDEALAVAKDLQAELIVALDPDADRCAVAIPVMDDAGYPTGDFRQLSGDQTGSLLGDYLAGQWRRAHPGQKGTLAASIVSSRLLGQIARAYDMDFAATLTGFKWIARAENLVFGYEEAIGFCTDPSHVSDKDGITAGLNFARLAAQLKADGSNVGRRLEDLYRTHGCYLSAPLTFRVEDLRLIQQGMERLQTHPPQVLADSPIIETADLAGGYQGLPPTTGMLLLTEAGDRVIVRPSGTEPKLKCYLEVILPAPATGPLPLAAAEQRLERIKTDLRASIGL